MIGLETGKDYSTVIRTLETNEIDSLQDLRLLDPDDFTFLGFSMALRNRVKRYLEQH